MEISILPWRIFGGRMSDNINKCYEKYKEFGYEPPEVVFKHKMVRFRFKGKQVKKNLDAKTRFIPVSYITDLIKAICKDFDEVSPRNPTFFIGFVNLPSYQYGTLEIWLNRKKVRKK